VELSADRLVIGDIVVSRDVVSHPLVGTAHVIEHDGRVLTAMSALDWERPSRIPTIADPGKLPPGAGSALLNTIAQLAERGGVTALRYAGPYPTPALYRSLLRSFRASADESTFTAGVLDRAIRLAHDEVPVDFSPAPHERVAIDRGFVELRDELERVVIDQVSYEPAGSPARLVQTGAGFAAELWFGDAAWARIAELDPRGHVVSGPCAPPPLVSRVIGERFPQPLRAAIAQLVADVVPEPLARDASDLVTRSELTWADLGARAARYDTSGLQAHAALWERIAPLGLGRLALALAEALAPVVVQAIVRDVVRARVSVAP
jgi:hypothetical protein